MNSVVAVVVGCEDGWGGVLVLVGESVSCVESSHGLYEFVHLSVGVELD